MRIMRSWMRRRSVSIWVSPGPPRKPKPPRWRSKMGPGSHQARFLIIEMGEFDLQRAFGGARAAAEDLQDQAGAVDHLGLELLLEIALLHRRERAIHHDEIDLVLCDARREFGGLALADIGRGTELARARPARSPRHRDRSRARARPPPRAGLRGCAPALFRRGGARGRIGADDQRARMRRDRLLPFADGSVASRYRSIHTQFMLNDARPRPLPPPRTSGSGWPA